MGGGEREGGGGGAGERGRRWEGFDPITFLLTKHFSATSARS